MNLRQQKKKAVRDKLYDVALGLFRQRGYDAVSIADITADAGVAKGTFFNHFPSKAHILADWYADITRLPELPPGTSTKAALEAILIDHLKALEADIELISLKISLEAGDTDLAKAERENDRKTVDLLSPVLEADPEVSICPAEISGDALAQMIVTYLTGIGREWRYRRDETGLVAHGRARLTALLTLLHGRKTG